MWALRRALSLFGTKDWQRLQRNGMEGRFSWSERVTAYEQIYRLVAPGR
jgi:glycogen synthase